MARRKLLVFPGSSLKAYADKGEFRKNYYNPGGIFDEIHFITFGEQKTEDACIPQAKRSTGKARVFVHALSAHSPLELLNPVHSKSLLRLTVRVEKIAETVQPDAVRAYSPSVFGYLARKAAKKVGAPFLLSLHTDSEEIRSLAKKDGRFSNWARLKFERLLERQTIPNADAVICAYDTIIPYAKRMGARNPLVIYNRVYGDESVSKVRAKISFRNKNVKSVLLCIAQQIPEKDPEVLLRAIKEIPFAGLVYIGKGNLEGKSKRLAADLGIDDRVVFIDNVSNSIIPKYYAASNVFVLPLRISGVAIPTIQALAAGIPAVSYFDLDATPSKLLNTLCVLRAQSKNRSREAKRLASVLIGILTNPSVSRFWINQGQSVFSKNSGTRMEAEESSIYQKLMKSGGSRPYSEAPVSVDSSRLVNYRARIQQSVPFSASFSRGQRLI